jgi:signal transduction histidine kinase/AraC-like DNA-binding protein/ABC-type sugar transport system substrate-binding protein
MSDRPRIGVWLIRTDPYWVQINEAVYLRGQQLPVDLIPLDAMMEFAGQSESDQNKLAEDILSFGLSALVATYIPTKAALRILNAGLPIIHLTETEFTHPNMVSFEGYYNCALLAGQFIAERLNGKGNILVVGGLWGNVGERGKSRVEAIADLTKNYPELDWQHIPTPWAYEQAYPVVEKALKAIHGSIHAIVGISDSLALAARNAGLEIGLVTPKTIIVGINGDPLALVAVAEGSMTATVETDSANFGREAMDVAYDLAHGKPSRRSLSIHSSLVTAENVGELALKKLISIADIPSRLVGINREAEQYRIKQLEMVTSINQQVGGFLDRQKLLHEVAELIGKNYHYNQVDVYRWHNAKRVLIKEYPQPDSGVESQIPIGQARLVGDVVLKGVSIFIPDTLHSLYYAPDPDYPHTRSRAILPIRYNQKVVGVLDLHSSRRVQHLRHELLGLQLLADQVGIAEQNTSLYEQSIAARAVAEKANMLKTRLLANVSHELRAPINLIMGYSQMALKELDRLPDGLRGDLHQIYQSGEHLLRLINDLLDMSRLEIGALDLFPEIIEPRPFLENIFKGMADNVRVEGVEWRLDLPENLPLVQADPVRLRQILLNLLSNASKFTSSGQISLGADVESPHLHIWVCDTGAGIPSEAQEFIFEPFGRVDDLQRRPDGIGLGLSITRRLVALHNGSMSLESKTGEGSTFHIYLPLPGLTGSSVAEPGNSTEAVLLLISHQPGPSQSILQLSQRRGLRIERIKSAAEVGHLQHPALIAWDMADAHPDDWALIAQLRRFPHLCRLPFVLYNQHPGSPGLTNVLVKPVSHATLLEMLESLHSVGDIRPILVVDDDPRAREMYEKILVEAFPGSPIQSGADGQIALEMLESVTPALVILDLMMPRVDGFTVLERMRTDERLQSVPVVVMSGKLLTEQDVHRLDYARVVFHSKEMLAPDETIAAFQGVLSESARLPQPTSVLVKRALAYLHQNYAMPLSRQEIARAVGVSEGYLSEIFKQEMGLSPWDMLNRFRIQRASELLKTTDKSITEIATQVGFDDPSYFGRVFSKRTGKSPKAYREQ